MTEDPLVSVRNLSKYFTNADGLLSGLTLSDSFPYLTREQASVKAVDDVSFDIYPGETLGLVGESGCGKSTLARTLLHLLEPTNGTVYFNGRDLTTLSGKALRKQRRDMQMIFQDPQSSLDPRMKVGPIIEEPMRAHDMLDAAGREARAKELLEKVGLDPQHYNRHPHAFSGGQRQRVNLARALSVNPDFIVCDEPVSALDVSIQAQVLNTMQDLQEEFDLTYLFITHDLSVIRYLADRVAVMYLGQLVEIADKETLFEAPQHPYTQALLSSIPVPDPRGGDREVTLTGDVPSPSDPPSGCRFRTRCPQLIQPPDVDLPEATWQEIVAFQRAVDRRSFEPQSKAAVRDRFFDGTLPSGAEEPIATAIDALVDGNWSRATTILNETFVTPSICANADPTTVFDPETTAHYATCHRHRDDIEAASPPQDVP